MAGPFQLLDGQRAGVEPAHTVFCRHRALGPGRSAGRAFIVDQRQRLALRVGEAKHVVAVKLLDTVV